MTIIEFIKEKYPIVDRLKSIWSDPYKMVADADDLPYDRIGPDSTGQITKLVDVNSEGRTISVMDLIVLSESDLKDDDELRNVYEVYMSMIDIQDVNLTDIMQAVTQYRSLQTSAEENAYVLSI